MRSLKSALQLNVLIELAVADCDFKQLLMRDPILAAQEYNRRMMADAGLPCNLPRLEVEMLQRVAGQTTDFRRFCGLLLEERDRLERIEEQRQRLEVLVPSGVNKYPAELSRGLRSA
jgi:hypothetical protein